MESRDCPPEVENNDRSFLVRLQLPLRASFPMIAAMWETRLVDAQVGSALFTRSGGQDEIVFKYFVGCRRQADVRIHSLGDGVVLFHV